MLGMLIALAVQSVSDKLPAGNALPPPAGDEQAVLAPINALFGTFRTGDSAAMLRLVYPDGRVTGTGTRPSGSGLRQLSWTEFATHIKPDARFDETITDAAVEVDGDVAMVWAPATVRVAGKVSNCGVDHFDLVRENGAWKVMNLTFSSRVAGCPDQ